MNSTQTYSPFESTFRAVRPEEVPAEFALQFLHSPDDDFDAVLTGHMDVWYQPKWLWPLYWLLKQTGILVCEAGEGVPVELRVRAGREIDGRPVHFWDRTFRYRRERHFNTILIYDADHGEVGDFVGKWQTVYLIWQARFELPGRFTLDTKAVALHWRGRYLWLPNWLWSLVFGVVDFEQKASGKGQTELELIIRHPWFGPVFGCQGIFAVSNEPKVTNG